MAVAGLHNVSTFDSSSILESHSPVSTRCSERDRPSTRASSLLRMWREKEGVHVVNHPNLTLGKRSRAPGSDSDCFSTQGSVNGSGRSEISITAENDDGLCSQSVTETENEHDIISCCSEQSADIGEVERERVRKIFREWMNNGVKGHSPNTSHRNKSSRAQWLGENECERVRIIREWVQMNAKQRDTSDSPRDSGVSEFGSQIELVRDGQPVSHHEVAERKPILKLCGRQALLDMLMRSQRERKKELQDLLQQKPVSDFAHRNRIQSLLRGWFLLNRRFIQDERPSSTASRELGLLRQKQSVSDLREGFLSKLDRHSVNGLHFSGSSNYENEDNRNEQPLSSREQEVPAEVDNQSETGHAQNEFNRIAAVCNIQFNSLDDNQPVSSVTEVQEQLLEVEEREQARCKMELVSSGHGREDDAARLWGQNNPDECSQQTPDAKDAVQTHTLGSHEMYNENDDAERQTPDADDAVQTHTLESGEMYNENDDAGSIDERDAHEADSPTYGIEGSMNEEFAWDGTPDQAEEWGESETEHDEDDLDQFYTQEFSELTEVNGQGVSGSWQGGISNQLYPETLGSDVAVHNHLPESDGVWDENSQPEAISSWLGVSSGQEADSFGRTDTFYFPDEDNIQRAELRQLLGRRRVSTLLRSGFRESLDRLIQSYVRRQNSASLDWELEESLSSPVSIDHHDQGLQNSDQDMGQPSWNQESDEANWPDHNRLQHIGNEWEIINELRVDMAMLHQRMDNMQRMVEACMDMQIELQRSIRQEVSAALNRSVNSPDACKGQCSMDDAKLDHLRKRICCVCSENNIDSLLYRCGHMCTCSKCAEKLLQDGKCPICSAPVVEVVRAYFIQ